MPLQPAPASPRMKLAWIGAGLLSLATLVALWITAHRIKERKMEARRGAADPAPGIAVPKGIPVEVGHFTLEWGEPAGLSIRDGRGRLCAEFRDLAEGDRRGWQELRLEISRIGADGARVIARFMPGAPCLGPGRYHLHREGLAVEAAPGEVVRVLSVDGGARLDLGGREETLPVGGEIRLGTTRLRVERDGEAGPLILVVGPSG